MSQLERHLAKCNSRPKPQPDYIRKDVNVIDPTEKEIKIGLRDLTDEELVDIIQRVSKIHQGMKQELIFIFYLIHLIELFYDTQSMLESCQTLSGAIQF